MAFSVLGVTSVNVQCTTTSFMGNYASSDLLVRLAAAEDVAPELSLVGLMQ